MIEVTLAILLGLIWNVAVGCGFAVLWNLILPAALGFPELTWLQGIGVFLILRLVLSPPKLEFTFGAKS